MPLQCNFAWRLGVCLDALQSQSNVMIILIYVRGYLGRQGEFCGTFASISCSKSRHHHVKLRQHSRACQSELLLSVYVKKITSSSTDAMSSQNRVKPLV
jgi:hypothetical protein